MNRMMSLEREISRQVGKRPPAKKHRRPAALGRAQRYSKPFYGTGEHVLTGLVDLTTSGSISPKHLFDINGVKFNYGEIIAMADLYETHAQMVAAPQSELRRLKQLIGKSTQYYEAKMRAGKASGSDVGSGEWQSATGNRYLRLAEENYSHFAPSSSHLIPGYTSAKVNHKREWEAYHRQAMTRARNGRTSTDLDDALVVNAFGDHFLTDAFAAGHLFNKDDLSSYFNSRVLSGNRLNADGERLIDEIGRKAFTGRLKAEFSRYETYEPHDAWWNIVNWNPNIHTLARFQALLKAIMYAEPDLFGKSLVAKVVHDKLNDYPGGLPVADARGNHWNLSGDDTLDRDNLTIIRETVMQSIMNVVDAASGQAKSDAEMFARVWDRVPRPTQASATIIKDLVKKYTSPLEAELSDRAARLLQENLDDMLNVLVQRRKLKRA